MGADDDAEGKTRIALRRVIERLMASDTLGHLHLASPFLLGYERHDDELTALRLRNWP